MTELDLIKKNYKKNKNRNKWAKSRNFKLCLVEKFSIAFLEQNNLLNKKFELISKYRHVNKHHFCLLAPD